MADDRPDRHRPGPTARRLAAVIFDFDGVILDSETAEFESHRLIYERYGIALTPDDWCHQIGVWVGLERWSKRLRELSNTAPDQEAFSSEQSRLFQDIVAREPMRGITGLIAALTQAAVPMAIASTSPSHWVVPAVERLGLRAHFPIIVTGDQVPRRKPAPDAYLEAARQLNVDPIRSVAIEDSGPCITAATVAGLKTVAIPHWLTETHDFASATLRVSHAGELTLDVLEDLVTG